MIRMTTRDGRLRYEDITEAEETILNGSKRDQSGMSELESNIARRDQLAITDEMVKQAAEVIGEVFDLHGHNGLECRPDGEMYLYSMEAARAGLEAALGVKS